MSNRLLVISMSVMLALLTSCSGDSYHYPSVTREFYTLVTNGVGHPQYILTDDGSRYDVTEDKSNLRLTGDTLVRVVGYYDLVDGGVCIYPPSFPVSARPVPAVLYADSAYTDPVAMQSIWQGNGYLNAVLNVRNAGGKHTFVFLEDSVRSSGDVKSVYITCRHNAHGDAEGYTSRVYISVPVEGYADAATKQLEVNFSIKNYSRDVETFTRLFE